MFVTCVRVCDVFHVLCFLKNKKKKWFCVLIVSLSVAFLGVFSLGVVLYGWV